jgi:hypothetical protein
MEDNMRALVLAVATLALSAGAASAQPANPVYPRSGYAPFGYGYAPSYGYGYGYSPWYGGYGYPYRPMYGYFRPYWRYRYWR